MVNLTTLITNGVTNLPQVGTGIDGLNDVTIGSTTPLSVADVLAYNGTTWENSPDFAFSITALLSNLNPLSRQTITTAIVPISVGTSAPLSPAIGDIWVDTN